MTIYWEPVENPVDPDTIEVTHIMDNGTETTGTVDVSDVAGMPDNLGGIAPIAVRELAVETLITEVSTNGWTPFAVDVLSDVLVLDYARGTPP